jgi:hypothetical protein
MTWTRTLRANPPDPNSITLSERWGAVARATQNGRYACAETCGLWETPAVLLCVECLQGLKVRQAWSVFDGVALCVRHTVEAFGWDDMDEKDTILMTYNALRELGYSDTY